jgi:hypothetical protein
MARARLSISDKEGDEQLLALVSELREHSASMDALRRKGKAFAHELRQFEGVALRFEAMGRAQRSRSVWWSRPTNLPNRR